MVLVLEGLAWANGTWVSWRLERLFVLGWEVMSIVFHVGKGFLCTIDTLLWFCFGCVFLADGESKSSFD